jgi:hypothetical protein
MNARFNITVDDDSRFDRLVDGALPATDYKTLLASLEDEPGGWRRCAMAFLEAQAWGREFSAIRRVEEDGVPRGKVAESVQPAAPSPAKKPLFLSVSPLLAAAACAVLAFGLGIVTRSSFYPADTLPTRFAGQTPWVADDSNPNVPHEMIEEVGSEIAAMKFVIDGTGNKEVVVPVISGDHPGEETLVETEPVIPDSVLRALRNKGHDIRRQQEFIPIALQDGRHVIFPVEEYRITPVSGRSY